MSTENVPVVEKIMNANDQVAMMNRKLLDNAGVFAIKYHGLPRVPAKPAPSCALSKPWPPKYASLCGRGRHRPGHHRLG